MKTQINTLLAILAALALGLLLAGCSEDVNGPQIDNGHRDGEDQGEDGDDNRDRDDLPHEYDAKEYRTPGVGLDNFSRLGRPLFSGDACADNFRPTVTAGLTETNQH
jgi:hypothetical protein